jgi:adenylosuccinate synthase
MLDVDHGTYPYVTSSSPISGGACTGAGIGPTMIDDVIGVVKAYVTRVGEGPFPTEINGPMGDQLREKGGEYGATTGRPRRCGWFDGVVMRYSARVNGLTKLAITKLDVLDHLPQLKICVGYELDGKVLSDFPTDLTKLAKCVPVYEEMHGWQSDTTAVKDFVSLPENAKHYIDKISRLCNVPVGLVSIGAERGQIIKI